MAGPRKDGNGNDDDEMTTASSKQVYKRRKQRRKKRFKKATCCCWLYNLFFSLSLGGSFPSSATFRCSGADNFLCFRAAHGFGGGGAVMRIDIRQSWRARTHTTEPYAPIKMQKCFSAIRNRSPARPYCRVFHHYQTSFYLNYSHLPAATGI